MDSSLRPRPLGKRIFPAPPNRNMEVKKANIKINTQFKPVPEVHTDAQRCHLHFKFQTGTQRPFVDANPDFRNQVRFQELSFHRDSCFDDEKSQACACVDGNPCSRNKRQFHFLVSKAQRQPVIRVIMTIHFKGKTYRYPEHWNN